MEIWREFVSALRKGEFPIEKIRPYHESLREPLSGFLKQMSEKASWQEWEATPEIHHVDDKVHFLLPLSFDGENATYCFSFLVEEHNWHFQHLEGITIRIDKIPALPTSRFPGLPEEAKMQMREEIRIAHQVRLFSFIAKEKGREFAFDWLKDGAGYSVAARAWVPFLPFPKAFILYLCWEQSNLYGNGVTLSKLDDDQAKVTMAKPFYFRHYREAAHLKPQIPFGDYRQIFETVWYDRAEKAGWELAIGYEDEDVVLDFKCTHTPLRND